MTWNHNLLALASDSVLFAVLFTAFCGLLDNETFSLKDNEGLAILLIVLTCIPLVLGLGVSIIEMRVVRSSVENNKEAFRGSFNLVTQGLSAAPTKIDEVEDDEVVEEADEADEADEEAPREPTANNFTKTKTKTHKNKGEASDNQLPELVHKLSAEIRELEAKVSWIIF